jgi:hypothetical protein
MIIDDSERAMLQHSFSTTQPHNKDHADNISQNVLAHKIWGSHNGGT